MTEDIAALIERLPRYRYDAFVALPGGAMVPDSGGPWINHADVATALAAARAEGPQWRDVETAPRDGTHIIVVVAKPNRIPATVHWFDGGWHLSVNQRGEFSEYVWEEPTHWMPLPQPPAARSRT